MGSRIQTRSVTKAAPAAANTETLCSSEPLNPDISALRILSKILETIFESPDFDNFTDAKIVLSTGLEVPVHRCILSRSAFFKNVFAGTGKQRGPKFELKELVRDYEVGFDTLVAVLAYLYCGKVRPFPKGVVFVWMMMPARMLLVGRPLILWWRFFMCLLLFGFQSWWLFIRGTC